MKQYFYLHIWAIELLDFDGDDLGLKIDSWPADDLFCFYPYFFCSERLRSILKRAEFKERGEGILSTLNMPIDICHILMSACDSTLLKVSHHQI